MNKVYTSDIMAMICKAIRYAMGGEQYDYYDLTVHVSCGGIQLDIMPDVVESSYELYEPSVILELNGKTLFAEDSVCTEAYHVEVRQLGTFEKLDEACDFLIAQFGMGAEWITVPKPYEQMKKNKEFAEYIGNSCLSMCF